MNVLITGANGQLGKELGKILPNAIMTGHDDLDITNARSVYDFVKKNKIDTIVNCAAYTAVDAAEDDFQNANRINAWAPKTLAKTGCKLVHISTDYVFDGRSQKPYKASDKTNPQSVYGWTKCLGERIVSMYAKDYVILRTAWLYSSHGKNFVNTILRLGAEKNSINVVSDQRGTPTYAADLANAVVEIIPQINSKNRGIYHYSNGGECSWYDFAREIIKMSDLQCEIKPILTKDYPTRAKCPKYSVLDKTETVNVFGVKVPNWQDGLKRCIAEYQR